MLRGFSIGSVLPSLSSIFAAPSLRIFIFVKLVRARRLFCHRFLIIQTYLHLKKLQVLTMFLLYFKVIVLSL